MPIFFQLHMLVNTDSDHGYPYVGISPETTRIINICDKQIDILEPINTNFLENDYIPVSRSVPFDLHLLDDLVENYTGQREYNIITRFTPQKHITLTYHSPTNECPKDYDIFLGYPDRQAEKLVEDVYPMMEAVKEIALDD